MRARLTIAMAMLIVSAALPLRAEECSEHFDSTFALIEKVIFERRGCTSATCHSGALPAGGLDLSPGVAWEHLIDVAPQTVSTAQYPGLARVTPGNKKRSLLWLNVAGATLPDVWRAPLRTMPLGGLAPLTTAELELVQLWIENGATRDGVVPGTGALVDACLPPPLPLKVEPLPPPPPGLGIQIRAPRQVLPPQSERETCFVSYYDLTEQVPAEFRGPGGDTFRYKRVDARQDPLSHHAVVIAYQGATPIESPVWGSFTCKGGALEGAPCAPKDPDACGADAICASPPVPAVACVGYGPGDASIGTGVESLFSTMGSAIDGTDGIFEEAPLKGILVWNSHAFNVTSAPAPLDMWINFEFASPAEQRRPLERFVDISAIANMHVPAFGTEEICQRYTLPPGARLLELVSHTHKRGKRFRVFEGNFACQGGAHAGQACSPYGIDPGLPSPDLCAGAPCTAKRPPRAGDCNADLTVSIDELITAVDLALTGASVDACREADPNGDRAVTVDELILAVDSALLPLRDPDASLLYISLTYADPLILAFAPPKRVGARPEERTLTYCALYDNGFTAPDEVKRSSRVPTNGGPCAPTHCAEGAVGASCSRHTECDSSPGAGDGASDACPVQFGITTDDEMFVLIGSYIRD